MKRFSQTLRIGMALFLAVFGTSALPTAAASALESDAVAQTEQTVQTVPPPVEETPVQVSNETPPAADPLPQPELPTPPPSEELIFEENTPAPVLPQEPELILEQETAPAQLRQVEVTDPLETEEVVDQTCDDVTTPGSGGWTQKYSEGYGDTVVYNAPEGYLIDQYCVKAGSTQNGNGPIIVPVEPPSISVTIDYPEKDTISHYVVHLIVAPQILVNPALPTVSDICGTANDAIVLPGATSQITYSLNGTVVTATLVNPATHDFGTTLNGYVVAGNGLTATYTVTYQFTNIPCDDEEPEVMCPANTEWDDMNNNELVDEGECFKKVFVCKYVGTPGIDERLQTGDNPISVSVNSIKDFAGIGSYFNDAQGRSFVLAFDVGQEESSADDCEAPVIDREEPTVAVLDTVCIAEGQTGMFTVRVTNTNDYAVEYRVVVEGGNTMMKTVNANSYSDFTFTGYTAGTYTYDVSQKVAQVMTDEEDELSFLSAQIAVPAPVYTWELVASGEVTLENCPRVLGDTDVCPNIVGSQSMVPAGYTIVNGQCVMPQVMPQVLGAATLPATIPATGESENNIGLLLGIVLSTLTYFAMLRRYQEA